MRQCRICFGHENEEFMLCPCDCRGSSAYIHLECLEEYFYHYPDRVCRVCHQHMYYSTPFDKTMFALLIIWLTVLIMVSNANLYLKLFFLSLIMLTVIIKYLRSILNIYVSIFIIASTIIISTTPYKHLTNTICLVACIVSAITVSLYIPIRFVLLFLVNILIACYCIAVVIFFSEQNDVYITSCFIAVFIFIWAFVIQTRPPPRYL
jgi:hypothetical protein